MRNFIFIFKKLWCFKYSLFKSNLWYTLLASLTFHTLGINLSLINTNIIRFYILTWILGILYWLIWKFNIFSIIFQTSGRSFWSLSIIIKILHGFFKTKIILLWKKNIFIFLTFPRAYILFIIFLIYTIRSLWVCLKRSLILM